MRHREEKAFTIQLHLSAEFEADYEGEDDGYAWFEQFDQRLRPKVVAAVMDALRNQPGWSVFAAPRGRDPSDAVDIEVKRELSPQQ
jgi:hypothetical protein